MLDFDYKKLSFKFDGAVYDIEYPTVKKINNFRKELKKDDADEIETIISFLADLGAPKEVVEKFRVSQLNAIVEELTSESSLKKS